jgi:hypothetical protein
MTPGRKQTTSYNGFAIPLQPDTELSGAMLIAEDEDGNYEPVGQAISIREAREIAESDMASRIRKLERNDEPGLCPFVYRLWARGINGDYRVAIEIAAQ